nr:MAG TPA: hypothetical protein [Bacteriophage sp.]
MFQLNKGVTSPDILYNFGVLSALSAAQAR